VIWLFRAGVALSIGSIFLLPEDGAELAVGMYAVGLALMVVSASSLLRKELTRTARDIGERPLVPGSASGPGWLEVTARRRDADRLHRWYRTEYTRGVLNALSWVLGDIERPLPDSYLSRDPTPDDEKPDGEVG
jgi:hypothetical protein